jgi:hypothetical protein
MIRFVIAFVAHYGWKISQMDVKIVLLNGDLQEEVYMEQLDGFIKTKNEHFVCKLNKTFYGLRQAPQAWYEKIDNFFKNLHITKCGIDSNLYY